MNNIFLAGCSREVVFKSCESIASFGVFLLANIAGEVRGFDSTEAETSIYIQRYMVSLFLPIHVYW